MNPEDAVDLGREALKACLVVGGPIVVLGLIMGLVVGLLQAMTQVQDQTVSFVPKIIVMIIGIGIALPWLSDKMVDYMKSAFETPVIHMNNPLAIIGEQPSWEGPGDFRLEQDFNKGGGADADDRLASPTPGTSGSGMPRLSQNYSMPTMKSSTTSSMPMLSPANQTPFEQPTPRIAERLETDF